MVFCLIIAEPSVRADLDADATNPGDAVTEDLAAVEGHRKQRRREQDAVAGRGPSGTTSLSLMRAALTPQTMPVPNVVVPARATPSGALETTISLPVISMRETVPARPMPATAIPVTAAGPMTLRAMPTCQRMIGQRIEIDAARRRIA